MLMYKLCGALLMFALLVPAAQARTNAACIATSDHVLTLLEGRAGVDASTVNSLKSFKAAQESVLDSKIVESAKAYKMDAEALKAQSLAERAAMKTQMTTRFGNETLYRDHLVMLTNCMKMSTEDGLGQSKAAFEGTLKTLEGHLG